MRKNKKILFDDSCLRSTQSLLKDSYLNFRSTFLNLCPALRGQSTSLLNLFDKFFAGLDSLFVFLDLLFQMLLELVLHSLVLLGEVHLLLSGTLLAQTAASFSDTENQLNKVSCRFVINLDLERRI